MIDHSGNDDWDEDEREEDRRRVDEEADRLREQEEYDDWCRDEEEYDDWLREQANAAYDDLYDDDDYYDYYYTRGSGYYHRSPSPGQLVGYTRPATLRQNRRTQPIQSLAFVAIPASCLCGPIGLLLGIIALFVKPLTRTEQVCAGLAVGLGAVTTLFCCMCGLFGPFGSLLGS